MTNMDFSNENHNHNEISILQRRSGIHFLVVLAYRTIFFLNVALNERTSFDFLPSMIFFIAVLTNFSRLLRYVNSKFSNFCPF